MFYIIRLIPAQGTDHSDGRTVENNDIVAQVVSQGDAVTAIKEELFPTMLLKNLLQIFNRLIIELPGFHCHADHIKKANSCARNRPY